MDIDASGDSVKLVKDGDSCVTGTAVSQGSQQGLFRNLKGSGADATATGFTYHFTDEGTYTVCYRLVGVTGGAIAEYFPLSQGSKIVIGAITPRTYTTSGTLEAEEKVTITLQGGSGLDLSLIHI